MQFIGQSKNLELINRWEKIPNFIIIQGDIYTGKTYLAKYISEKFKKSYILMKNSVSDVRTLVKEMKSNANAVYHFKDFDTASVQARNALLKITEETPEGNCIIITGSRQIPTLESRARKLVMSAYEKEDMLTELSKYYDKSKMFDYYKAGFNTPTKALLYKDYDGVNDLLSYAYTIFGQLSTLRAENVIVISKKFSNKYEELDHAILFLDMLINIINYKSKYELNYRYSFQNVLDNLIECKEGLLHDKTLNRSFMLYKAFYNITLLGGKL